LAKNSNAASAFSAASSIALPPSNQGRSKVAPPNGSCPVHTKLCQ
jgi:hypothetical protein